MLPFRYAIRNLFRDPMRLLQTLLGSLLVTLLVMGAGAFNQGMTRMLSASGDPLNVILLGAGSEESLQRSEIPDKAAGIAASTIPGIQERAGRSAVSPELHFMGYLQAPDAERVQILLRGVKAEALMVYPELSLLEGRFPRAGELMPGRMAWKSLGIPQEDLKPGMLLEFEGQSFRVSGIFAAPGTVMESEIWADLNDLRTLTQRDSLSGVTLRMQSPDHREVKLFSTRRRNLELSVVPEQEYYAGLAHFYAPIRGMTWVTALLIGVGALAGGLNTLYAAFASRIAELATLQTLGYSRAAILLSLIQEALMACLLGSLLALTLALQFLDGLTVSFSMGSFQLDMSPGVVLAGLLTGLFLGVLGTLPPALRCLVPPLPAALRSAG